MSWFRNCLLLLSLLGCGAFSAHAATFYVNPTTGDNNHSSAQAQNPQKPWRTLNKAIFAIAPGSVIEAQAGTYAETPYIQSNLTLQAAAGARPIIKPVGTGIWNVIDTAGKSNITIRGFEIDGSTIKDIGNGISIQGGSHHITIADNWVHDCGGGGISTNNSNMISTGPADAVSGSDYITIEDNVVWNNCFWSPYDTSGVSLFGCTKKDDAGGFHNIVRRNRIFGNIAKYTPPSIFGGDHTDGNGIIVDVQANGPLTLIENNLVYNNGGRGIHVFKSQNVVIRNNTSYKNCRDPAIRDGELTAGQAANVTFANNIAVGNGSTPVNKTWSSTGVSFRYNLYFGGAATYRTWDIYGDPLFVSPGNGIGADFHVGASSPAINAGETSSAAAEDFARVARPQGAKVDKGAYELSAPVTPTNLAATAGDAQIALRWDASENATTYVLQRALSLDGPFGEPIWSGAQTSFTDTGLANGTPYFYIVSASNGGGQSPPSTPIGATPFSPNRAPVAANDAYSLNQDTVLSVAAPGVLENDGDADGDALSVGDADANVSGVQPLRAPAHGTLVLNADGSFSYAPAAGFRGADSFSYRASDGTLQSDEATVTFTVNAVNRAPVAASQSVVVAQNTVKTLVLTATDADGDELTFAIVTPPAHGTLSGTAPNLSYAPAANYLGADSFSFRASDGAANSDTATVSLSVVSIKPTIISFSPLSGKTGDVVTVNGTNLGGATALKFGGITLAPGAFAVNEAGTQISLAVPANAVTGKISVTTPAGTATSRSNFTVTSPALTGFSPSRGPEGTLVTLNGARFSVPITVRFGGVVATEVTLISASKLTAVVPLNAVSGPLQIGVGNQSATSAKVFVVTPKLGNFSPPSGAPGASVTLSGTSLGGATSVKFNNLSASFTIVSPTQITAIVPTNATTGLIKVTTPAGTAASASSFVVAPRITKISPGSGGAGTIVTLSGANFAGATQILFGGVSAGPLVLDITAASAGFQIVSATQIKVKVPDGATTGTVSVVTPAGSANSATIFKVITPASSLSAASAASG